MNIGPKEIITYTTQHTQKTTTTTTKEERHENLICLVRVTYNQTKHTYNGNSTMDVLIRHNIHKMKIMSVLFIHLRCSPT